MKTVLFVLLLATGLFAGYERSGDTVIDTEAGLQWQDNAPAETNDRVWRDAHKYCLNLDLAGFHDWRLPTRKELLGLFEAAQAGKVVLKHAAMNAYWTSEICRRPIDAWAVYWGNGHTFENDKCDEAHLRCVRDR